MNSRSRSLFSFCSFHFLDDGFTDSMYLLLPFIAAELSLSFGQVGLLKGIFSGSTGLFQFPLSLLGERMGELIVLVLGTFGLTGGFLILSRVYSFTAILSSIIFAKISGAGQHGLSSSVLSRVFEVSGRRAAMGTYNFSGDLGMVCIPFILALMINQWGWRQALLLLSTGGMATGAFLYLLISRQKDHSPSFQSHKMVHSETKGWGVENRKKFSVLLTIGIIDISARHVLLTFLPFLLLQKGFPVTQIGFALTLLFAGGALGKFACGIACRMVWHHSDGCGHGDFNDRGNPLFARVTSLVELARSALCGNGSEWNLFCPLCHCRGDDRACLSLSWVWTLLCHHLGLRSRIPPRLRPAHGFNGPLLHDYGDRPDGFCDHPPEPTSLPETVRQVPVYSLNSTEEGLYIEKQNGQEKGGNEITYSDLVQTENIDSDPDHYHSADRGKFLDHLRRKE